MMDFTDFLFPDDKGDLVLERPTCPVCHLELPVSGECC